MKRRGMALGVACSGIAVAVAFGCGSQAPSGSAPDPADGVLDVRLQGVTVSALPACTSALAGQTAGVTSPPSLYWCSNGGHWVQIPCLISGDVAYASATRTLWACSAGAWTQVTLPAGAQGPKGDTGPQGPQGPNALVIQTPFAAGAGTSVQKRACPTGGTEIDTGTNDGVGGFVVGSENTTYVCNAPASATGDGHCSVDADCNDDNLCTVDLCSSGLCEHNLVPAGTVCRAAVDLCDATEYCTGASPVCPSDTYVPKGYFCREPNGPCDKGSTCTGTSTECPPDAVAPAGAACASATACGLASICDGVKTTCPPQAPVAAGTVCLQAAPYECTASSSCDGSSITCPPPAPLPAGTQCNPERLDYCIAASVCDGVTRACAAGATLPAGTVCRAASTCMAQQACDGTTQFCGFTPINAGASCNTATLGGYPSSNEGPGVCSSQGCQCGGYLQPCCVDPGYSPPRAGLIGYQCNSGTCDYDGSGGTICEPG
jgi:hypothetical protein